METVLTIAIIAVIVSLLYLFRNQLGITKRNNSFDSNNESENLKKYFGNDYARILGGKADTHNDVPGFKSAVPDIPVIPKNNFSSEKVPSIDDILSRKSSQVSNTTLYGGGVINSVINQKMGGASFLGIRINVENAAKIPETASEEFCNLLSVMLAKGIGACAKNDNKTITVSVTREENNRVIVCTYPERSIPETDEKMRNMAESMNGTFNSETTDGMTTDEAVIPSTH